jgi:hypothetical protein
MEETKPQEQLSEQPELQEEQEQPEQLQEQPEQLQEQLPELQEPLEQPEQTEPQEQTQSSSLHLMVEAELRENLKKFFNEIDLAFDYVPKSDVEKLNAFLKRLHNENVTKFTSTILEKLKQYEEKISYIVMSKTKLKSSHFSFLNEVVLFNDILDFSVFANENKNTKRTIVNYLYNMYMSSFVLQSAFADMSNIEDFTKHINQFVSNLKVQSENQSEIVHEIVPSRTDGFAIGKVPKNSFDLGNILSNITGTFTEGNGMQSGGLGGVLQSLMGNKEIMNLASDLSKDIQSQNLDPMALLSSMMSGKPNSAIDNLVSNITGKIEKKINNGDIDKDLLQTQAQSILKNLGQPQNP